MGSDVRRKRRPGAAGSLLIVRQCQPRNDACPCLAAPSPARLDAKSTASYFPNKDSLRICFLRVCIGATVELSQHRKGLIVRLHFRSNDLEGLRWRQRTTDRFHRALGRLQGLVARIKVRLDDINGPAGGVDKRCIVEMFVRGSGTVAISVPSRSWQDSVEEVASRIRQRVALQFHRATMAKHQSMALMPVRARVSGSIAVAESPRRFLFDKYSLVATLHAPER